MAEAEVRSPRSAWRSKNPEQARFLSAYYDQARREVDKLAELEGIASPDVEVINRFLRERGFQIQLKPFSTDVPRLGVASVFKLLLEWMHPGRVTSIRGGAYPAVSMKNHIDYYSSMRIPNPILSVKAKNGDTVYMAVLDNISSGFDILKLTMKVGETLKPCYAFDGAVFPMVTYDEEVDISWLRGMEIDGERGPWAIEQALQQTKFRMNELGAKVESAVAMGMRLGCSLPIKPPLIIDRPFLLWVTRPGITHPLFIAHFTEANWKKPAGL